MSKKQYTSQEKLEVMRVLKAKDGSFKQTANKLNMSYIDVENIKMELEKLHNYTPRGMGAPHMEKYLIARRHLRKDPVWDNDSKIIQTARDDYDAGYTEMCQGRDGLWILLYSIPRKTKDVTRKIWFVEEEETEEDNLIQLGA